MKSGMIGAIVAATAFLSAPQEDKRADPPDGAAQKAAEKLIRDLFKEEYARPGAAGKLALSKRLLQQANETKDDPAVRFVLFREAKDLAAEGGDLDAALKVIDQMAAEYKIPALSMKTAALTAAGKAARTPEENKRLAEALISVTEQALAAEEYDLAAQLSGSAVAAARRSKEMALVGKADATSRMVTEIRSKVDAVRKAREKLAAAPEDAPANLAVGQFLCFVKEEWDKGLPHLEKGGEGRLKELAGKDLARPVDAGDQVSVGDGWWDLAEKEKGRTQEALRRRAFHWYELAAPRLAGLHLAKVNQRLTSGLPAPSTKGLFAHWKLDEGSGDKALDSSGNQRHGTIQGAAWVKGKIAGALGFNGEENRVILNAGEVPPPWTASMWVKREESPNPTARLMDAAGGVGSSLRLEQSINTRRAGITKYRVVDHAFNYTVPAGAWVHLTFVGTEKAVSFYANGALIDAFNQSISLSVDRLGSHGVHSIKGCLDDVRVYSRELSPAEIELLSRSGK